MQTVITINAVIMALFFVCYSYQFFYVAVALLKRKKFTCRNENHRIAVLIAARNEENVIGQLLDSIHANLPVKEFPKTGKVEERNGKGTFSCRGDGEGREGLEGDTHVREHGGCRAGAD